MLNSNTHTQIHMEPLLMIFIHDVKKRFVRFYSTTSSKNSFALLCPSAFKRMWLSCCNLSRHIQAHTLCLCTWNDCVSDEYGNPTITWGHRDTCRNIFCPRRCWLVRKISATTGWIPMRLDAHSQDPQRMKLNDSVDPLDFPLAPPAHQLPEEVKTSASALLCV